MTASFRAAVVALSATAAMALAGPVSAEQYFDAHNHITGILPYYAYADLPAFIASLSHSDAAVGVDDRLALYRYLDEVWRPAIKQQLGNAPFSPADGQRFALGARAALEIHRGQVAGNVVALNGVLERVLTATPWSEFDSAYAFRGGPAGTYLRERFYHGDGALLSSDLCKATVLDLAATNIESSEQSLPFLGGWHFSDGTSQPLSTILCTMNAGSDPVVIAGLRAMNKPMPQIKIVLMTHTSELATAAGGKSYSEWSKTGRCANLPLPEFLKTDPQTVRDALLGWDRGKLVVPRAQAVAYYDMVVGIDTAAPETTCFTAAGMQYYTRLVTAVYDAAKARRRAGWRGKLLVHTHVGEGATVDYVPVPPRQPWTFQELFGTLPPVRSNAAQAAQNISTLLDAIGAFERTHPDAQEYVVFRLAHDTWATPEQANTMREERVEADVNLESNVATGAYPVGRMPAKAALMPAIDSLAANPATNFELNDLLGTLVKDPNDPTAVGDVLGNAALKYLLEAHVRCLLGTDADGVEHSDIVKEYEYASALIAYWNRTDPIFRARASGVDRQTLFANVDWHLRNMSSSAVQPY
jgi:hypothetical protein